MTSTQTTWDRVHSSEWKTLWAESVETLKTITVEVVRFEDETLDTTPLARIAKHYGKPVRELTEAQRREGLNLLDTTTARTRAAWGLKVTYLGQHIVTDQEATDLGFWLWEFGADQTFKTRKAAQAHADTFAENLYNEVSGIRASQWEESLPFTFTTAN
jgi:hypothetical protein